MYNALFWVFGLGSMWSSVVVIASALGDAPFLGVPPWIAFLSAAVQWAICWFSAKMAERNGEWL